MGGVGIDVVRFHLGESASLSNMFWGRPLPADWSPQIQVTCVAAGILLLALVRASLNYVYAVQAGKLVHEQIVVDLRAAVYDKLQRLSFRFFDAQASGSIINRVTGDVQAVRAFVDGVLIQFGEPTLDGIAVQCEVRGEGPTGRGLGDVLDQHDDLHA